jgi:hypothetical protein
MVSVLVRSIDASPVLNVFEITSVVPSVAAGQPQRWQREVVRHATCDVHHTDFAPICGRFVDALRARIAAIAQEADLFPASRIRCSAPITSSR